MKHDAAEKVSIGSREGVSGRGWGARERRGRRLIVGAGAGISRGRPNRIVSMRRTAAASERLGTNMLQSVAEMSKN